MTELEFERQFTGLKDVNGKNIMNGDIVWWDDESKGKWSRIAIVVWKKPSLIFRVIASPHNGVIGHGFNFGNFIWTDTEKYLEVVSSVDEAMDKIKKLQNASR